MRAQRWMPPRSPPETFCLLHQGVALLDDTLRLLRQSVAGALLPLPADRLRAIYFDALAVLTGGAVAAGRLTDDGAHGGEAEIGFLRDPAQRLISLAELADGGLLRLARREPRPTGCRL